MKSWEVRYLEKIDRAEGTKSFRFERPRDFEYLPGQYFFVEVPGEGGRRLVHHFSFSNTPTETDFIEFTTRIRESEFKQTIDAMPIGTVVIVSEIHGEFTLDNSMKKVAFLCGGIGITAAFSNILWAVETNADVDIVLLYANRSLDDVAFRKELDRLAGEGLRIVHILSKPEENWTGPKGHIDTGFIQAQVPDWKERSFFVSGPPAMVEAIKKVLIEGVGIPENKIKTENFLGY
jgi:ferredoxin-NADP reductase